MWCQGLANLLEMEISSFCVGLMVKKQKYYRFKKLHVQSEKKYYRKFPRYCKDKTNMVKLFLTLCHPSH